MGNNSTTGGSSGWEAFNCFTDDGDDSMITDSSISEINSEEMIQHIIWEVTYAYLYAILTEYLIYRPYA